VNSAADQQPSPGQVFQASCGTVSAARRSPERDLASLESKELSRAELVIDYVLLHVRISTSISIRLISFFYTDPPPACSNAWASRRMLASPKAGPKTCRPTGSFPQTFPQGTEIPGTPAKDPVTVYISARYIWSGSSVLSPSLKAGTGDVGVTMTSTFV